jgi:hypothetical protein
VSPPSVTVFSWARTHISQPLIALTASAISSKSVRLVAGCMIRLIRSPAGFSP